MNEPQKEKSSKGRIPEGAGTMKENLENILDQFQKVLLEEIRIEIWKEERAPGKISDEEFVGEAEKNFSKNPRRISQRNTSRNSWKKERIIDGFPERNEDANPGEIQNNVFDGTQPNLFCLIPERTPAGIS